MRWRSIRNVAASALVAGGLMDSPNTRKVERDILIVPACVATLKDIKQVDQARVEATVQEIFKEMRVANRKKVEELLFRLVEELPVRSVVPGNEFFKELKDFSGVRMHVLINTTSKKPRLVIEPFQSIQDPDSLVRGEEKVDDTANGTIVSLEGKVYLLTNFHVVEDYLPKAEVDSYNDRKTNLDIALIPLSEHHIPKGIVPIDLKSEKVGESRPGIPFYIPGILPFAKTPELKNIVVFNGLTIPLLSNMFINKDVPPEEVVDFLSGTVHQDCILRFGREDYFPFGGHSGSGTYSLNGKLIGVFSVSIQLDLKDKYGNLIKFITYYPISQILRAKDSRNIKILDEKFFE